jgi:uncharacterized protein
MQDDDEPLIVWDRRKAWNNLRKHKVSFEEAETVFLDPLVLTKADPDHSLEERRFLTVGLSSKNRLVMVAHTDDWGTIRIISARLPTRRERYAYEND